MEILGTKLNVQSFIGIWSEIKKNPARRGISFYISTVDYISSASLNP